MKQNNWLDKTKDGYESGVDWDELDRITDCGRNIEMPKRENTDELLKQAINADKDRAIDLYDLWRFGTIDREQLNTGCKEIIANAKFKSKVQDPDGDYCPRCLHELDSLKTSEGDWFCVHCLEYVLPGEEITFNEAENIRRGLPHYTEKNTLELMPGDIVTFNGAKVLITLWGRISTWQGQTRKTMVVKGRIVEYGAIPKSWAIDGFWNIQGNDLARWTVIN